MGSAVACVTKTVLFCYRGDSEICQQLASSLTPDAAKQVEAAMLSLTTALASGAKQTNLLMPSATAGETGAAFCTSGTASECYDEYWAEQPIGTGCRAQIITHARHSLRRG